MRLHHHAILQASMQSMMLTCVAVLLDLAAVSSNLSKEKVSEALKGSFTAAPFQTITAISALSLFSTAIYLKAYAPMRHRL
jgi:hypothetical protein